MKIKHLPVLTGLLFTAIVSSSCLKNDTKVYEPGTDATIHSIAIDTIYGKETPLTIDQANNRIFNIDSLPVHADTIIDKLLITKLVTGGGWVTRKTAADKDTLYTYRTDSLDFRTPQKLTVYAMDSSIKREYTITLNLHKQDPDILSWKKFVPEVNLNSNNRFMVALGDELLVFKTDLTAYKTSSLKGDNWTDVNISGLTKIDDVIANSSKDCLYVLDNGALFTSNNGSEWTPLQTELPIEKLIAASDNKVMLIAKNADDKAYFANINIDNKPTALSFGSLVPTTFDTSYISSTYYERSKTFMLMTSPSSDETHSYAWMSDNGLTWNKMISSNDKRKCPKMSNPQIFFYNDNIYAFGAEENFFYKSQNGLDWTVEKEKFMLPEEFKGAKKNALTIDSRNYIWINFDQSNELWRARLNKYGHKIQK